MLAFLNSVLDTLIRNLDYSVRVTITIVCLVLAVLSFRKAIKIKDDKSPLIIGWIILCVIFLIIASLYMFL